MCLQRYCAPSVVTCKGRVILSDGAIPYEQLYLNVCTTLVVFNVGKDYARTKRDISRLSGRIHWG